MAEETITPGAAPQGEEVPAVDVKALQAQIEALTKELEGAKKKAEQAVGDAAKGRDRLRTLMETVQVGLKLPEVADNGQPWEQRIQALEDMLKERVGALEADLQTQRAAAEAAKLDALRLKIGAEFGLPAKLIERLQGEDEKALRADAEELKKAIPTVANVSPMNPAGGEGTATEMAKRLYERNRGPAALGLFTPEGNAVLGGGILDFKKDDKGG